MESDYIIVLYSKYSQKCKEFISVYEKSPVQFIKPVCVDNKDVRLELLKSPRLNVKTVPCVLLCYPNNTYEKFEGPEICTWLIQQITENSPTVEQSVPETSPLHDIQQAPQPTAETYVPPPQPQYQQPEEHPQQPPGNYIPIQAPEGVQPQQPIQALPSQQPSSTQRKSAMEIAMDMEKERNAMLPSLPDPKIQQQALMGQQTRSNQEQQTQQQMGQQPQTMIEKAMAMQKEREVMQPSHNPNLPTQPQIIPEVRPSQPTAGRSAAEQAIAMQKEREQMEATMLTQRPNY